jgi:hypothetical protein
LTSITIPSSVMSIGVYAFSRGIGLTSINVDTDNNLYDSRDNCNAIIETACNTLIAGCKNTVIPNSVRSIGDGAFSNLTNLTNIEIPSSVRYIHWYAFCGCTRLSRIKISKRLLDIGLKAFDGMSHVKPQYQPNGALRAFKAFKQDWACREFQYQVGEMYHQKGKIECCKNGFHACPNPLHVFNYYDGNLSNLHFAEVELSGEMDSKEDKVAASDIKIVRELTASDLAEIYNSMEKE